MNKTTIGIVYVATTVAIYAPTLIVIRKLKKTK